jgi:3-oxoacyl-[acyl-carrier protein] reductase
MTAVLSGKRALVTGAARGIGRAIAGALAAEGAAVMLADLDGAGAERGAAEIAAAGGIAFAVSADVTDEARVVAMFEVALKRLGGLDILVNNAGVILEKPLLETTAAEFDRLMAVNLRGVFLVGREGIRHLRQRGGRVINLASDLGYYGRSDFSAYCASKSGVLALTRSWAKEFAPGILVNSIAPGPIDTEMLGAANMSAAARAQEENIPLARIGKAEEVAAVAVFLAGPGASFVTGQAIGPNGGSVMP